VAQGETPPERLPERFQPRWRVRIGQGYAGPAVVDSQVLVFHRIDDDECLQSLDRATGKLRWEARFAARYRGGVDPDVGPRCVPVVANGTVIVYGAAGELHAVRLADGQKLWSRDVLADFGGNDGYFGAGSTPLVLDDQVLVNAGGRNGAGLVALDLHTGKTRWQSTDEAASYAAPTLVPGTDPQRVLSVTRLSALLVDPRSGRILARHPFGRTGPTVNAATPIAFEQYVFLTASYQVGATLLRIDGDRWAEVWSNDETLSSQYNTPVYVDGFLYGIHGREDLGVAELRCVEATSGRVAWTEPSFGVAHLLCVGDRLLLLKVDGQLVLAETNPRRFTSLGRLQVSSAVTRALPAYSNGELFLRTNDGRGGELLCVPVQDVR
jgi:outer membrane protein assembly factor BamB